MADMEARNAMLDERWLAAMNADFNVVERPETPSALDQRQTRALEYIAFQLGKIRQAMEAAASKP